MARPAMDTERLDDFLRRPRRAVWVVSLPMMAGMLLHVFYNVVDTAFVGRLGPEPLAALTIVFPLFFIMMALANGIGSGITVLVAQAIGRRDPEAAERAGGTAIALGVGFGVGFLLLGLAGGHSVLRLLGASAAVAELAWHYFEVLALGAPVFFVSAFLRFLLTGEGDAKTPMFVMALTTVLNIGLDPVFIFVLELGVQGAALATLLSAGVGCLIFLYLLLVRRRNVVRLKPGALIPSAAAVLGVLAIGLPASLAQLTMSFGRMFLNKAVSLFGDTALAGFGVGSRIDMIMGMPIIGLAAGTITVIGMFAGAARVDLVRSTALYAYRWALTISLLLGLVVFAASHDVMRVFTDDPATIQVGRHYLSYMVFAYPMMGFGMVTARLLLGLGHAYLSLTITVIRLLLVAAPVAFASVLLFGAPIDGVWVGILAGSATSTVVSIFVIRWVIWVRDPTARARQEVGWSPGHTKVAPPAQETQ